MKMCKNFVRHCGPHHSHRGKDHFRKHKHRKGGKPHSILCHRGRKHSKHHRGPPVSGLRPSMVREANCHHHPQPYQPENKTENHPNCHHCRKNNDRPRSQPLPVRPSSCPPLGRTLFGNGSFDQSTRGREPFHHRFEINCCPLLHRCDTVNRHCGHCTTHCKSKERKHRRKLEEKNYMNFNK